MLISLRGERVRGGGTVLIACAPPSPAQLVSRPGGVDKHRLYRRVRFHGTPMTATQHGCLFDKTPRTMLLFARRSFITLEFHICTVSSQEAEAMRLVAGDHVTPSTSSE